MFLRRLILALLALVMSATALAAADEWFIWERLLPPPTTRADWLAVAKQPGPAPIGEGWRLFDSKPYATFEEAMAAMGAIRATPQFLARCDRRWHVYKNVATNEFAPFDSKQIGPIGPGYILDRTDLCCETAFEYAFGPGFYKQCGAVGPAGSPDRTHTACRTTGSMRQAANRDASGRLLVEAAIIHVLQCAGPKGPETLYVYQYVDRPGVRVIRPGDWATAIGGRDFGSLEEAVAVAATAGVPPPAEPPAPPPPPIPGGGSVTGEYRARDGRMCLIEAGGRVTGYYNWSGGGVIEGSMQGLTLVGTWKDRVGSGQIRYEFAPDHSAYEHIWKSAGMGQFVTAGRSTKVSDRCDFPRPR